MQRLALMLAVTSGTQGLAFTLDSPIGKPCHEHITSEALRAARSEFHLATTTPTAGEKLAFDDLPFVVDADLKDLEGYTLLMAVRDPDLKGLNPLNLQNLASVHNSPTGQREHCLRSASEDGADGSGSALVDCRAFIRENAVHAVEAGLSAGGQPDASVRTRLDVFLALAGPAHPELPTFYVYAGEAMHTLQDSFAHTWRSSDVTHVDTVLNWIDFATDSYEEDRDGPPHDSALDQCDDSTERNTQRRTRAIEASTALLRAMLAPGKHDQRVAAIDAVLDEYLTLDPGCGPDNRWCDAPERQVPICSATGVAGPSVLLLLALLVRRRAWRKAGLSLAVLALPAAAQSQRAPACTPGLQVSCGCPGGTIGAQRCNDEGTAFGVCECAVTTAAPATAAPPAAVAVEAPPPPTVAPLHTTRFAGYLSSGISIDNTAAVFSLAGRYRINDLWLLGLGAEWNPWLSFQTRRLVAGTVNIYASVIKRWPISEHIAARTSLHLGTSMLLFNLYGAPAGDIGAYGAVSFIGLEARLGPHVTMVFDPCEVSMPIPHLTGVPVTYRQYRFTVGMQFGS